jgi:putative colanic acid biosynthesis acetyltransferase WcaF
MKELRYQNRLSKKNRLMRLVWGVTYWLLYRPTPRWTLHGWRNALLRMFGAKIGVGCRIDPSVKIWAPWNIELGDYVAVAQGVELYAVDKIRIGSKVALSQRAFICTASHDIRSLKRPLVHSPIMIGNHAWIAAEAMLLPGITIGEGAVIGARSLQRKDAGAWTVWAGNPSTPVGERKIGSETPDIIQGKYGTENA